jgi:hypothetical protein
MLRQLISPGYFSCIIQDTFDYTSWSWQFIEALKEGVIYPRWSPLSYWGYGSPAFVLYPPLPFYFVAFFNLFTNSVIAAMNVTKLTALFFSATGMFFFVKQFYSKKIALFIAIFYILFPYNIFGLYYSGTFASVIALIWFAPILLFLYRYIICGRYDYLIYAGVCYGGLILTHLINAYIFSFIIIFFVTFLYLLQKKIKALVAFPLIITIGLLTSAFYVLPLIYEKQFINTEAFIEEGFNFAHFFILPNLTDKLPPGSFWPVYYYIHIFYSVLFLILITIFSVRILKSGNTRAREHIYSVNIFFVCIALFSLFLLFGISSFLWEHIPLFKYVQFPYRWLNITTFAVVFLSAAGFFLNSDVYQTKRRHNLFIASLFLIFLLLNIKYISSANMFTKEELIPIKPATSNTAHMPIGIDIAIITSNDNREKITLLTGKGNFDVVLWQSAERIIEMTAQQSVILRIRTFNFPGWKAYVDGVPTEIITEELTGAMLINVPTGKHRLVIKFEDTPIRYYSKVISLVSLLGIVSMLALCKKKKYEDEK